MIRVSCPKCKAALQVEDKHAGKVIACPTCKTSLRLPQAPAPVPAPPVGAATSTPSPAVPNPVQTPPVPPATQPAPASAQSAPAESQAGKLKSGWRGLALPVKAALIGGTSFMFLSCFLCCGFVGFKTFSTEGKSGGEVSKTEGKKGGVASKSGGKASNNDSKKGGVASKDMRLTQSYFPTTGTQERQYIERRFDKVNVNEKNPKPDLKLKEKKYSGRWVEPTQGEKTDYGPGAVIWASTSNLRAGFRVSDVGVERLQSFGMKKNDYFIFWTPLAKWGSLPGEVWDATLKKKSPDFVNSYSVNRTYSSLYEATVENDEQACALIVFTENHLQARHLQKLWLMDGVGIVRSEIYTSTVFPPGTDREEEGKWWRPSVQRIFQEWKGDVAPLEYLPRDAK